MRDTPATNARALAFAQDHGFYLAAFNHLVPFPGTPLYRRLARENRLLKPQWWLDPHYQFNEVAFRPAAMEPTELRESCLAARKTFYSPRQTWQRHRKLAGSLSIKETALFWGLNLLHRAEVRNRDGFPLGDESWQGQLLEAN